MPRPYTYHPRLVLPPRALAKLEPLEHLESTVWSRRGAQEHQLIYHVTEERVTLLQCRYHYS